MAQGWRSTSMFVAGAVAGGAAVLAAYLGWIQPRWPAMPATTHGPTFSMPSTAASASNAPAASTIPPAHAAAVGASCPSDALAQLHAAGDGQFSLEAALSTGSGDPSAFLTVAREAAAQGHLRDAEVALIAACHAAAKAYGLPSAPVADIKSQMGQHYVALAARESTDEGRDQLLQRASTLFAESATVYAGALGKNASKTRLAQQRLAALREPGARMPPAEPLVVANRPPAELLPDTSRLGAARSSSLADRPPLRDEDLGKVESDLDRLYAQALSVSRNPAATQRRHQQALAQRSACRGDAECLRNWYAQRKRQLFAEF